MTYPTLVTDGSMGVVMRLGGTTSLPTTTATTTTVAAAASADSIPSVTVCMDAVRGRCSRDPCRYFHPPGHLLAQIQANQQRARSANTVAVASAATNATITTLPAVFSLLRPFTFISFFGIFLKITFPPKLSSLFSNECLTFCCSFFLVFLPMLVFGSGLTPRLFLSLSLLWSAAAPFVPRFPFSNRSFT